MTSSQSEKKSNSWLKFSSPRNFYPLASKMIPWFMGLAIVLTLVGLYMTFFVVPPDYQQGNSYRIMYIHVPAAWMSMLIYLLMALYAGIYFVLNVKLADMMAGALAVTGAIFTVVALWTGSMWGKPTWGAWWVWDARLTSELLLLFLYLGYISLRAAIDDPNRAAKASGLLALVGVVNVPIIYFSVTWWNTLHQGASITTSKTSMATEMFVTLLIMVFAFWMYTIAIVLMRVRNNIIERERDTGWLVEELGKEK